MKLVTEDGKVIEIENLDKLNQFITPEELDSLKQKFNDIPSDEFDFYLRRYVGQDRRTKRSNFGKDAAMVVAILSWTNKEVLPTDGFDPAWFHYLYPEAHINGGPESAIYAQAKGAILHAQSTGLNGCAMLDLYHNWVKFFKDHRNDAMAFLGSEVAFGNDADLEALKDEALRGAELPDTGPTEGVVANASINAFIMPLDYGVHRTYFRVSHDGGAYRIEYFDRQRQTLILKGREIRGYLNSKVTSPACPIYFTFTIKPGDLTSILQTARGIADSGSHDDLGAAQRKEILETFAARADEVGECGVREPAQDPVALHCAWASLESIIRARIGSDSLQSQVDFMRVVVVTRYTASRGEPEEKAAAGLN